MNQRRKVLHVVESFGSGVATAVDGWISATSDEVEHVVAGYRRPGVQIGDDLATRVRFIELPAGLPRQARHVWRAIRQERPAVVHAHSTLAGGLVRSAPFPLPPVVYTPHCFGFERTDLSMPARYAVRAGEWLMSHRTAVVAACAAHEADLAIAHLRAEAVVVVPVITPSQDRQPLATRAEEGPVPASGGAFTVAAMGRISAQKDPEFLIETIECLWPTTIRFVWIGGGPPGQVSRLEQHGVTVTGWMPREQAIRQLAATDAYVHTAAWEGAPLTVVEAMALGLPVVARDIDAISELGIAATGSTPSEIADLLAGLTDGDTYRSRARASSHAYDSRPHVDTVADALLSAYEHALGTTRSH